MCIRDRPGTVGSFSILPGHAPIVSSLKAGTLGYTTMDGEEHTLDIQGGLDVYKRQNLGCGLC